MLNILRFADSVYNSYVYDIPSVITKFDFYKTKFWLDQMNMKGLCSVLYKKLF
jgi:hypothetical protein